MALVEDDVGVAPIEGADVVVVVAAVVAGVVVVEAVAEVEFVVLWLWSA